MRRPTDVGGVYEIVSPSGKRYVGSAVNLRVRYPQHKMLLRKGTHHCTPLQHAWSKYGEAAMTFRVIEVIDEPTREKLLEREQWYLNNLKPEYNVCKIAGSRLGVKFTDEQRAKLREIQARIRATPGNEERRVAALRATLASPEYRENLRAAQKESWASGKRVVPPGFIERTIRRNKSAAGKSRSWECSDETLAKMSAARKERWQDHDYRARAEKTLERARKRISDADVRAKMAAAKRGKPSVKRSDPTKCAKLLHPWVDGQKECRACANAANKLSRLRRLGRVRRPGRSRS